METFSQLIQFDMTTVTYYISNTPLTIQDQPRFPHRGFMVDTSRHFLTLNQLKMLVDSLSYAKLNVLHWHIVDDQSFPVQLYSYPKLQTQGAYSNQERYTQLDIVDLVEYARSLKRGLYLSLWAN